MKQYTELRETFTRYIHGQLSAEEAQGFLEYIQSGRDRGVFEQFIQETIDDPVEADQIREALLYPILDQSWTDLQKRIGQGSTSKTINWRPAIRIAAAIVCVLSVGLWFYLKRPSSVVDPEITQESIMPGQQTATLTLADGTQIRLAESSEGELAKDGGVVISKGADGHLIYEIKEGTESSAGFNTLSTARGETYSVKLPDGTQVWLNAASSIRYAANFSMHTTREVELEGEAYFEVAKDEERPFIVHTDRQQVKVLGTRFNVSSYTDEPDLRTTLLEGSVEINYQNTNTLLYPGQQSNLSDGGILHIHKVDTEPIISWIHNEFMFDGDDIESVMRKLERWYNLKVVYKGAKTKERFGGGVSRFEEVGKVLQLLEKTGGVHFKIEGRTVYVHSS